MQEAFTVAAVMTCGIFHSWLFLLYVTLFSSQCYLQSFVGVCISVSGSPLSESAGTKLTKEKLGAFSPFFVSGSLQADVL